MSSETAPLPHMDHTGLAINADARFRHVFAEGFDPILLTDHLGRILDGNRQALTYFGIDRRSFPQINIRDLHHPDEPLPDVNKLTGPGSMSFHSRVVAERSIDGRRRQMTLNVEVRARRLTPGREGTWQWIYHDVSSRVELQQMRDDLIAMLLHDLQSPLGNVISTIELLRMRAESAEPDETLLSLLDIAARSSGQLQRLIASLMDINRLEAGQPVGQRVTIPLADLVREAYEIEEPSFTRRGVVLHTRLSDDLPPLSVEPNMISRVLLNLFDNALKYSADGETVVVQAYAIGDGMLHVTVADRGAGIPREFREVIFDKFQRIKSETSKGLGLGLAFCRLAVEAHGGRIWVDDTPGGGARFNLTLPQGSDERRTTNDEFRARL